jgi:HSP20 family protein
MRVTNLANGRGDLDDLFQRLLGDNRSPLWPPGGYEVPTEVFQTGDRIVVRMDLPGVDPDDVEVTIQESTLVINGKREFPHKADDIRFVRRGTFYGDFAQRVSLGKGLNTDQIGARFDNGVLELSIPYAPEVQPKKIEIEVGKESKALTD